MESLESLKERKSQLERRLEKITTVKHGTTPWAPGVQDQYYTDSYSYEEYSNSDEAKDLKRQIDALKTQIETYAERARAEREAIIESQTPKYTYSSAGKEEVTKNPAMAARYNARERLYGMSKLRRTLMKVSGQKRKFEKLWLKAVTANKKEQEKVATDLDKMFR